MTRTNMPLAGDRALFRSAEAVLRPRSLAIVGASETAAIGWSKTLFDNLRASGFDGRTYLINPRREAVWGERCYPNFAALPEPVDLALVVVAAPAVPDILSEGKAHGLRAAIVYAGGFKDGGAADGAWARICALCEGPDGLRVSGPNGMGVLALRERALLYPQARVRSVPTGNVGVVFSSGGSLQHWLRQAAWRGLGFSYAVSAGDELDLDLADYLNFLVDDRSTLVVCALIEGVRRPEAFIDVARRALALRKPIAVVKVGRSPAARSAVQSHTGALAGDDDVFSAVCERYGIVRCETLDDLYETALAFGPGRLPTGPRVGVVCHSGGIKGLFLDAAASADLTLPPYGSATEARITALEPGTLVENPLDAGATLAESSDRFLAVCRAIVDDPDVDLIALQGRLETDSPAQHPPRIFAELAAATNKPLIAFERINYNLSERSRTFQAEARIPFLQGIPRAANAVRALIDYGKRARRGVPPPLAAPSRARPADPVATIAHALRDHGVGFPAERLAAGLSDARDAAQTIGYPVALKLVSPQVVHKTEAGAVRVGIRDERELASALHDLTDNVRATHPGATISGYLVQAMAEGVELIVGAREDPQFGPIVLAGLGGIFAEALGDVVVRLLPLDAAEAAAMLARLQGAAVLGPFRGRAARDVAALAGAVVAVGKVFLTHRAWLSDLEINPLVAGPAGTRAVAVDLRVLEKG